MIRDLIMAEVNRCLASASDEELLGMVQGALPQLRLEQVLKLQAAINTYVESARTKHREFVSVMLAAMDTKRR